MTERTAHDFTLETLSGEALPLAQFRGRPILLVNTASKCGFTPQYEGLQALWSHYRARGFTVVGAPCNDFGNQEPAGNQDIATFCAANYGVSFPMTGKLHVRGARAHPLFAWLAREGGFLSRPRWNFYKYLIGADGKLESWFTSIAAPMSQRVRDSVERALS